MSTVPSDVPRGDHAAYFDAVARMIRAAGKRVGNADPEDLVELVRLRDAVEAAIDTAITGQRARYSWGQIGAGLGTSRQYVHRQYGHHEHEPPQATAS